MAQSVWFNYVLLAGGFHSLQTVICVQSYSGKGREEFILQEFVVGVEFQEGREPKKALVKALSTDVLAAHPR